jgi:hypothetical protein
MVKPVGEKHHEVGNNGASDFIKPVNSGCCAKRGYSTFPSYRGRRAA